MLTPHCVKLAYDRKTFPKYRGLPFPFLVEELSSQERCYVRAGNPLRCPPLRARLVPTPESRQSWRVDVFYNDFEEQDGVVSSQNGSECLPFPSH
jgi:hypothetical protein